ncbi:hypothetical protein KR059_005090 [Drosophila kikkawai]|nr:hypothetical protein KR059_005090 [Drosophila kikkawai]
MEKTKPLLHDTLISNRVKKYLEEHVGETYLDIKQMTKELMNTYPDYRRRKFGPFKQLVHQAFSIISESYCLDKVESSDDGTSSQDSEVQPTTNNSVMSNMMNSLYSQDRKPAFKTFSEPIDISSGDEDLRNIESKNLNGDSFAKTVDEVTGPNVPPVLTASASGAAAVAAPTQGNALKRLMSDQPEMPVVAKKAAKPNVIQGSVGNDATVPKPVNKALKSVYSDSAVNSGKSNYQQQNNHQSNRGSSNRHRKYKKEIDVQHITECFREIGGMEDTLKELCEMFIHIKSPDFYFQLGLMPSRGILLHGPPGCGKTFLARAISGQLKMPLLEVPATELVGGISGESEERIREVFEQAVSFSPCVLFIDEIDAIAGDRQHAAKDMNRRIVSQLISSLDNMRMNELGHSVIVIAATTRPDVLDPGLRRIGRFDHEFALRIPTRKERREILRLQCETLTVDPKLNYDKIAELTPGYVGADLMALVCRAAHVAVKNRSLKKFRELHKANELNMTTVTLDDDEEAADRVSEKEVDVKPKGDADKEEDVEMKIKADGEKEEKEKEKVEKEAGAEGDKEENKEEEKEEVEIVVAAETKSPKKAAPKNDNEKDKSNDKEEEMAAKTETEASKEAAPTNGKIKKSTDSKMEVDEKEDEDEKENDPSKESSSENEYYEPTLAELTNFLDNPPDDFSDPNFCLTLADFLEAIKGMQPSAKREGFVTVPDTTWEDIGALHDIREELKLAVLAPVKYPDMLERLGLTAPSGVMLCGPPGCGKTLLAKAIANEAGINFISVKGPELMNMYVGESERAVRACFQRARNSAPCVIFFDEFDSLCPKRSEGGDGNNSGTRIVNQLLTEMDGVEERKGVYILAATNRPDIIDPAILRPGRLDTILYVGLPEESERADILKATTKNGKRPLLADDVNLDKIAAQTEGYTGADLAGLVKQASMFALRQSLNDGNTNLDDLCVRNKHFKEALLQLRPSVNEQDRKIYNKLREKYAAPRVPIVNNK